MHRSVHSTGLALVLALSTVTRLSAAPGPQTAPRGSKNRPILPPIPVHVPEGQLRLFTHTLANGLQVVVVENPAVPLVTIEIAVHNGAMNEPLPLNGLSHLYEHMFFKGNAAIPNQEAYIRTMRQLGAVWNGTTGNERVDYFFTMSSSNLEKGMEFMAHAIKTPRFDPEELKRERQVVLGEFDRNEADPDYHLEHAVTHTLFYKYPTYKDPLGNRDSIQKATVEQMKWMQKVYYIPNNSALFIAGDVHAAEVFKLAERYYADWKRGPDPFIKYPLVKHPPLPASKVLMVSQPVKTVKFSLNWQGPDTEHDLRGTVAADVFSFAVNQDGSRLQKALVDAGLATSVRLDYETLRNTGQIGMHVEAPPEKALDAIRTAVQQAAHFKDPDYVTPAQWKNAQTLLAVEDLYEREKVSAFSHTMSFWWAVAGLQAYLDYIPTVKATTQDEGARYADRYIDGHPMVLGVMSGPEDASHYGIHQEAVEQILGQAWPLQAKSRGTQGLEGLLASTHPVGSNGPLAAAPPPESVETMPDVQQFQVDGIDVLLRHNPADPVVAASAYFKGGSLNLTDANQGIEQLALLVASQGGTKTLSRNAKAQQLDSMGSMLTFSTFSDYSRLDLTCVKEFFAPSWDLFASSIVQPGFAEADVDLFRRRDLSSIKSERVQPESEDRRLSEEFFFRGHPYAHRPIGTEEVVSKLNAADLAGYWQGFATKSRMLLVVVGDVDRPTVEAALHRSLGTLPAGEWKLPPVPQVPPGQPQMTVEERKLPTTYVRGMFVAPPPGHPEYTATRLATDILSERLFQEVRTKRNLSYSVFSGLSSRLANYGVLYVTSTHPSDAVKVMLEQVQKLAAEPLAPEELHEYVAGFITRYYLDMETSRAQAGQWGHAQIVAGDWREVVRFVENVRKVTPPQVQEAVRQYLHGFQWAILGDSALIDKKVFGVQP